MLQEAGIEDNFNPMSKLDNRTILAPQRWLLLLHQLPAKPAYLRVKVWRRLQGIGAGMVMAPLC